MAVDKKRALTDEAYRKSLTPAEQAELEAMLTEEELDQVAGGARCDNTAGSCPGVSRRSNATCGGAC